MYNEGCKLLNCIQNMSVNSLACVRVKGNESESFRTDKTEIGCVTDAVMEMKMGRGKISKIF